MAVQMENYSEASMLSPQAGKVRIPEPRDKVFKDEGFFSFDSPVCIK